MKYGITIDRVGLAARPEPLKYLTSFAHQAEQIGCTYIVVGDRFDSGLDPFLLFGAIAEASGKLQLVTSVLILPPRGVLITAKQFTALDILTGGRVIAGVGTGSMYREYQMVGMPSDEIGPRFEEAVHALRAYMAPDDGPFKGRFYDTTGVSMEPRPIQKPSVPIWIGSWGRPAGLRRVARLADGWLSSAGPGHQTPEQYEKDVDLLNKYLVEEGKDPSTFPNAVSTMALYISEDEAERAEHGGPGFVPRPAGGSLTQPAIRPD